jgi:hypothetical protein
LANKAESEIHRDIMAPDPLPNRLAPEQLPNRLNPVSVISCDPVAAPFTINMLLTAAESNVRARVIVDTELSVDSPSTVTTIRARAVPDPCPPPDDTSDPALPTTTVSDTHTIASLALIANRIRADEGPLIPAPPRPSTVRLIAPVIAELVLHTLLMLTPSWLKPRVIEP